MSYHNVRDKYGRFTKKKAARKSRAKAKPLPTILNVFLLDDSGSMASKIEATVEGFNSVVDSSKKASETTGVKYRDVLVIFGEPQGYYWSEGTTYLSVIPSIGKRLYRPNQSSTALYDAILDSMTNIHNIMNIDKTTEYKVVLTVFTDGLNNVNQYKMNQVKLSVEERRTQGWVINFIGAGEEAVIKRVAETMGIDFSNTLAYRNTSLGTRGAMGQMASASMDFAEAVSKKIDKAVGFFAKK